MTILRFVPVAAALMLGGCAYDYADGYAPNYPPGYDQGMGSGQYVQPGDLFGGQNVASVDAFYEPLANYGRWVDSSFGYGFQPSVPQGWRPYVNGHWGENRLWISDDPWGWATDHYGRWGFDRNIGWVWVPGTEWAPSWVAWREADDVTGWAPIPPGVSYSIGVGFGSGFNGYDNYNSWYGPSWVWVPRADLYRQGFGGGILPWNNGYNYWRGSRWNYNSGWNGRPGYGNWNHRPNTGTRPGTGRPDNDRPGYVRPGGQPGYNRPDGNRPEHVRPGNNGQPGATNTRPGGWNGQNRPGTPPGTYQPNPDNPGYVRPQGNRWQGHPGGQSNGQPDGATTPRQGYGGTYGSQRPARPAGEYSGQPRPAAPAANIAQPARPSYTPPPRAQPQPQAEPQQRSERAPARHRDGNERNERPQ